jgi:hypothetical protein
VKSNSANRRLLWREAFFEEEEEQRNVKRHQSVVVVSVSWSVGLALFCALYFVLWDLSLILLFLLETVSSVLVSSFLSSCLGNISHSWFRCMFS